jgi:hypothetical protein
MSIGITNASFVRRALGVLLAFGAINAFAGGYYGVSGAKSVPVEWLDGSPFANGDRSLWDYKRALSPNGAYVMSGGSTGNWFMRCSSAHGSPWAVRSSAVC